MAVRISWAWLAPLALLLAVVTVSVPGLWAGQAVIRDTSATAPERQAVPTVSLVGTIAIVPESRTILVDVAVGADFLRVAAVVTPRTRIEATGAPASFEDLQPGNRVRLNFRRITTGNEALSVEVLRGAKS